MGWGQGVDAKRLKGGTGVLKRKEGLLRFIAEVFVTVEGEVLKGGLDPLGKAEGLKLRCQCHQPQLGVHFGNYLALVQ